MQIISNIYAIRIRVLGQSSETLLSLLDQSLASWYLALPTHLQYNPASKKVPPPHVRCALSRIVALGLLLTTLRTDLIASSPILFVPHSLAPSLVRRLHARAHDAECASSLTSMSAQHPGPEQHSFARQLPLALDLHDFSQRHCKVRLQLSCPVSPVLQLTRIRSAVSSRLGGRRSPCGSARPSSLTRSSPLPSSAYVMQFLFLHPGQVAVVDLRRRMTGLQRLFRRSACTAGQGAPPAMHARAEGDGGTYRCFRLSRHSAHHAVDPAPRSSSGVRRYGSGSSCTVSSICATQS